MEKKLQRLAKAIARAGICPRRQAEKLILDGRVKVNQDVVISPATNVTLTDVIEVDDIKLPAPEQTKIWLFHKPKGCITSTNDPQGRKTVFDFLPKGLPHLIAIGRLDYNTEGLLLFTNDGDFAREMELPINGLVREYKVRIHGKIDNSVIKKLANGINIGGIKYAKIEVTQGECTSGTNSWINVKLIEGKNREIRKVFAHFGLNVSRLIRIGYGKFKLGTLKPKELYQIQN